MRKILEDAVAAFRIDKWANQEYRPEVWIEKEALVGVIAGVCQELDVPYFACRGYTSQSEQWNAARRMERYVEDHEQCPIVFHLGDHDPSGIDMTRDNRDRLELLSGRWVEVRRLALNFDQIEEFRPPPNPAKFTDSRINGYVANYGTNSWELDALDPATISKIVRKAILSVRDAAAWKEMVKVEKQGRKQLADLVKKL